MHKSVAFYAHVTYRNTPIKSARESANAIIFKKKTSNEKLIFCEIKNKNETF